MNWKMISKVFNKWSLPRTKWTRKDYDCDFGYNYDYCDDDDDYYYYHYDYYYGDDDDVYY